MGRTPIEKWESEESLSQISDQKKFQPYTGDTMKDIDAAYCNALIRTAVAREKKVIEGQSPLKLTTLRVYNDLASKLKGDLIFVEALMQELKLAGWDTKGYK